MTRYITRAATGLEKLDRYEARWCVPRITVTVREPNDELIAMLTGDDPVDWDRARELGADA